MVGSSTEIHLKEGEVVYPVSDRFLNAVAISGVRKTVVDIYYGTQLLIPNLPIVDGHITVDRKSDVRRSGSITIGDPDLFPTLNNSTGLEPYGIELIVKTGFVFSDSEELVPLGVFIIDSVSGTESEGLFPTVNFFDRAKRVQETSTLVTDGGPQSFGGSTVQEALDTTLRYPAPGWPDNSLWVVVVDPELPLVTIPGGFLDGDTDRWQLAVDLANAIGGEAYFDVLGTAQVKAPPFIGPTTTVGEAVWSVKADIGDGTGNMIDADRTLGRDGVYNSVLMLGSTPNDNSPQPYGHAFDSDPQSKTFYGGLFGRKTLRMKNTALTSDAQCLSAAKAQLRNVLGLAKNLNLKSLCNPALTEGDIILVTYPDTTTELHLVDGFDIPFGSDVGSMSIKTRTVQYA